MRKFNIETQEEKYLPAYLLNATTALFGLSVPWELKGCFIKRILNLGAEQVQKVQIYTRCVKTSMKKAEELLWEKVLL